MTTNSYSYSLGTQPVINNDRSEPTRDLVAFTDCELIRLNEQMALVINRFNGKQQVIAPEVVDALTYCSTFETINGHAHALARTRPELKGNIAMAQSALNTLNNAGMLLRASDMVQRFKSVAKTAVAPTRVFIITCDRPAAVERLLDSMLEIEQLSRHQAFYLIDDSRDPENQQANADLVAGFSTRTARGMAYFGPEQQQALMHDLITAMPEHEQGIRFLIDQARWIDEKTYGRSRTLALLLSVGYRAIVLDDDILCRAVNPIIEQPGIGFGGGTRQAAFFPDNNTMMSLMQDTGFDALSGHAEQLGQPLGHAVHTLKGTDLNVNDLESVNAMLVNVLKPEGRVLITQSGSWGDPGTGGAHWALSLDPDSVDRLLAAPHGMNEAITNRRMWLGSPRPSIVKMAVMSQMTGLDNSALLPPYFPVFRGEDLLFGAMVETMHHDGSAIEYGWSVPHLPIQKKETHMREPIAAKGGIGMFARYLTERVDYNDAANPEIRLQTIAWDLRRMAGRSTRDLIIDYRTQLGHAHGDQLRNLRSQQAHSHDVGSNNWQQYIQRGIDEVIQAINSPHKLSEITRQTAGLTDVEITARFRALAMGFAAALDAWPQMREICEHKYK